MGVGGQGHAPAALPPGKSTTGWAPGLVWTGAKNLAPTGIRYPDRPARSESLYRLSYRGPLSTSSAEVNVCSYALNFPLNGVVLICAK